MNNGDDGFVAGAVSDREIVLNVPNHAVTHKCTFHQQPLPGSNTAVVAVVGVAVAAPHQLAAATTIRCVLKNGETVLYDHSVALPGHVAVLVDHVVATVAALTVCSQGSGLWSDVHSITSSLRCQTPGLI